MGLMDGSSSTPSLGLTDDDRLIFTDSETPYAKFERMFPVVLLFTILFVFLIACIYDCRRPRLSRFAIMHHHGSWVIMWISLAIAAASPPEGKCLNGFPVKETADILRAIVAKYGEQRRDSDAQGNQYSSILIDDAADVQWNNRSFRLNTPENTDATFHLKALQFLDEEVFIVPLRIKSAWRAIHPDRTYALKKITFDCGRDERACGLQCCPRRSSALQEKFMCEITEKRKRLRRAVATRARQYYNDYQVMEGDILYSLEKKAGMNCVYRLSQFDQLYQNRTQFHIRTEAIYYKCPAGHGCCSLGCVKIEDGSQVSRIQEIQVSPVHSVPWRGSAIDMLRSIVDERGLWWIAAGSGCLIAFVLLLLCARQRAQRMAKHDIGLPRTRLEHRQATTETQTSSLSLYSGAVTSRSMGQLLPEDDLYGIHQWGRPRSMVESGKSPYSTFIHPNHSLTWNPGRMGRVAGVRRPPLLSTFKPMQLSYAGEYSEMDDLAECGLPLVTKDLP
ncbi:unnamed protein product, partial [Mesorhabditis spiculigera]